MTRIAHIPQRNRYAWTDFGPARILGGGDYTTKQVRAHLAMRGVTVNRWARNWSEFIGWVSELEFDMRKSLGTLEDTTALLPTVIADAVVRELAAYLHMRHGIDLIATDALVDKLAARAEHLYQANANVRRKLRSKGNAGRDYLYTFMRHWLSAEFPNGSAIDRMLPDGFSNGQAAPKLGQSEVAA